MKFILTRKLASTLSGNFVNAILFIVRNVAVCTSVGIRAISLGHVWIAVMRLPSVPAQ